MLQRETSGGGILALALAAGGFRVFAGLVLAVALADLLFDFLGHEVYGGVKILLHILRKKIRARNAKPHRAFELALRNLGGIMFQRDARIDGEAVEMFELVQPCEDMLFDGLG